MKRILALAAILAALVFSQKSAVAVIPQTVNPAAAVTGDTMNTPNTVVYRDSNGDFQTGNISDANLGQGRVVYTQAGGVLASSSTFTVSPEGNHGIGAPNPKQALQISSGTLLIDAGSQATSFQIGASTFVVQGGGNVGIGVASPAQKLDVVGSINTSANVISVASVTTTGGMFGQELNLTGPAGSSTTISFNGAYNIKRSNTDGSMTIGAGSGGDLIFAPNAPGEAMRVKSGGNVGIGTTAPGALLDVRGTFQTSSSATITGVTDGSLAGNAYVGAISSCAVSAQNFPSTGVAADFCTVNLSAGSWSCSMNATEVLNGATETDYSVFGIGTVTGNDQTGLTPGVTSCYVDTGAAQTRGSCSVGAIIKNPSTATTFYGKILGQFSVATPLAYAGISCQRMR